MEKKNLHQHFNMNYIDFILYPEYNAVLSADIK